MYIYGWPPLEDQRFYMFLLRLHVSSVGGVCGLLLGIAQDVALASIT